MYEKLHDFEFHYTSRDKEQVYKAFLVFAMRILGEKAVFPNDFSYFGCVTSDLTEEKIKTSNHYGYEIRLDYLKNPLKGFKLLSKIREGSQGSQILLTLRSASHFGKYSGENY